MLEPSAPSVASSRGYRSATDDDRDFVYRLVEMTERPMIERLRSWDEAAQRVRIDGILGRGKVDILTSGAVPVGIVAVERGPKMLEVNLLRVLPIWQGRGHGRAALDRVVESAERARLAVTTTIYKVDAATDFYRRAGFAVEQESMLTRTLVRWPQR